MDFQVFSNAKRLWDNEGGIAENRHRMVAFRRHFSLNKPCCDASFWVAADSDFIVTLDGKEVARGQYPDDPTVKTFDTVMIPELSAGEHVVAILVYYCGGEFSGYTAGLPGLYFDWNISPASDGGWLAHNFDAFQSGAMPKVSPQLGYAAAYDLRKAFDFGAPDLLDEDWHKALEFPASESLAFRPRPVGTKCVLGEFRAAKCVKSGRMVRFAERPDFTAAQLVSSDNCYADDTPQTFPVRWTIPADYGFTGLFLIADLGEEETGFIEFEVKAAAGTRIDFAHGEHLADGRVRAEVCGRNFADTVICREGRNRFQLPFRHVGARFVELHITGQEYFNVTVYAVGIRPWRLPLGEPATFECDRPEWLELRRRAVHTLELCMHEHYEDCPWREQAMYTYDSRMQILYGYCLWGNYQFARASLELFRFALREDKHLYLCVPSRIETVIPIYSFIWVTEIFEYYLYSGDITLFESCRNAAETMLQARLVEFDQASGLYRTDPALWNFYEWTPGLDGRGRREGDYHALYNLYFLEAMECYAKLLEAVGEDALPMQERAARLRSAVEAFFFDADKGIYASFRDQDGLFGYHDHTQALMLALGAVPEARQAAVGKALESKTLIPMTLSPLLYQVWALEMSGAVKRNAIAEQMFEHYRTMLTAQGDTLWETERGQADFFYGGSLCHGWSALPIYVMYQMALGVKPLTPGFQKFIVDPVPGQWQRSSGEVQTPAGKIKVAWQIQDEAIELEVTVPKGLEAEIRTTNFQKPVTTKLFQA